MIRGNIKRWDRIFRIALAFVMLFLGWRGNAGFLPFALRILALYPLVTGLAGWCPIVALWRLTSQRS